MWMQGRKEGPLSLQACASGFLSNRLATLPAVSKKMIGILFTHKQFYGEIRHNTDTASALITYHISIPILPHHHTEKSLRHVAIVAKFVDLNQTVVLQIWQEKTIKMTCMSFLCIITLRNKTAAHTFLPSTKQMAVSVKKYLGL